VSNIDERDDCDDLPPDPRPRARSNPTLTLIAILAGVLLLLLVVCGGAVALFWMKAAPAAPPAASVALVQHGGGAGATRRVYSRDEFPGPVIGADRGALGRTLGDPFGGVEPGPPEVWHYGAVSLDPATRRIDADAAVVFGDGPRDGIVKEVRFATAADPKGE
jgi:hypothetical protein